MLSSEVGIGLLQDLDTVSGVSEVTAHEKYLGYDSAANPRALGFPLVGSFYGQCVVGSRRMSKGTLIGG